MQCIDGDNKNNKDVNNFSVWHKRCTRYEYVSSSELEMVVCVNDWVFCAFVFNSPLFPSLLSIVFGFSVCVSVGTDFSFHCIVCSLSFENIIHAKAAHTLFESMLIRGACACFFCFSKLFHFIFAPRSFRLVGGDSLNSLRRRFCFEISIFPYIFIRSNEFMINKKKTIKVMLNVSNKPLYTKCQFAVNAKHYSLPNAIHCTKEKLKNQK